MRALLRRLVGRPGGSEPQWRVLDFPSPYRAMLAVNSDVEWTGWALQLELIELLARLEVPSSFSYWFFAPPRPTWSVFAPDGTPGPHFDAAATLIREGVLDTIHAFGGRRHGGGIDFDRRAIERGYDALERAGARTPIFSNHGSEDDRQNIGGEWASYQEGDVPGKAAYHLDRTLAHGVRFFWTDIDYVPDRPWLGAGADRDDTLFRTQRARDGHPLLAFRRFLGELEQGPCAGNLGVQLRQVLDTPGKGYCVLYQHLGVHRNAEGRPRSASAPVLPPDALEALETLRGAERSGEILIATTAQLLAHAMMMTARAWSIRRAARKRIEVAFEPRARIGSVELPVRPQDLAGFCIETPPGAELVAHLGGEPLAVERAEAPGGAWRWQIPWRRIEPLEVLGRCRASPGSRPASA